MTINLTDPDTRRELVKIMEEIYKKNESSLKEELTKLLNKHERLIQNYLNDITFEEGNWFRTPHNLFVPAAMISICKNEDYPRDLVYAAQLHDAGNSLMKVSETTSGADWENKDKRRKNMEV